MGAAVPFVMAGASVLGAVTSSVGAYNQAQAEANMQRYQSQVAANNAAVEQQKQQLAATKGEAQAQAQGMQNRAKLAQIRAAIGASGIDPNSGSAADVQAATAALGQQDVLTVRSNTAKEIWGYRVQEDNDTQQSNMLRDASHATRASAFPAALGSFLSGISSTAKSWTSYGLASGDIGAGDSSLPDTSFYDDPALMGVS